MNGWKLYIYDKFFFPLTQTLRKKECEENRMYCTPESLLHGTYSTAGTPDILGLHDFSRSVGYGKRDKLGQKHEYFQSDFTRFDSSLSYIGSSLQPSFPDSPRGICPMPENFTPENGVHSGGILHGARAVLFLFPLDSAPDAGLLLLRDRPPFQKRIHPPAQVAPGYRNVVGGTGIVQLAAIDKP